MTDIAKRLRDAADTLSASFERLRMALPGNLSGKALAAFAQVQCDLNRLHAAALLDAPEVGEGELRKVLAEEMRAHGLIYLGEEPKGATRDESMMLSALAAMRRVAALRSISRRTGGEVTVTDDMVEKALKAWNPDMVEAYAACPADSVLNDLVAHNKKYLRRALTAALKTGEGQ